MKAEEGKKTSVDRLNYTGELQPLIDRIATVYSVGKPTSFSVIETGYEDCNVTIETSNGKYVAKIFSKERDENEIIRYVSIMERVLKAGVNHPELMKLKGGRLVYRDEEAKGISSVLMKFIEGQDYIALDRPPNTEELQEIIKQASLINSLEYKPRYLFDSWAIPNIEIMYEKVRKFVNSKDLRMVEGVIARYKEIPLEKLPYCFVHGDFTKANVIKGDNGQIYILDFSVSNWYPRIQELSVIAANLLSDEKNQKSLQSRLDIIAGEYTKFVPLTKNEIEYIYPYALAGIAMEFLGAHQEKYINRNDTEETNFWMELGRNGLQREINS